MNKRFLFLLAAVGMLSTAQAQITFTRADFDPFLQATMMTMYTAENAAGTTLAIGAPGAGVPLSLDAYTFTSMTYPQMYVDPALTPYVSDFPGATHAMVADVQGEESYAYYRIANDGVYSLGVAALVQGMPLLLKNVPEMTTIKFPLTRGVNWSYNGDPSVPFEGLMMQTRSTTAADASGTLTFSGQSVDYIRVKTVRYATTKVEFGGTVLSEDVEMSVNYTYYTKAGLFMDIDVDTLTADSPTPTIEGIMVTTVGGTSSVEGPPAGPDGFTLAGMYPNPVVTSGTSTITWSTATPAHVTLEAYDLTGRKVATVWQGMAAPGMHLTPFNTAPLESGSYLLRATTGSVVRHALFTVVR
jgi:hypothetical protein